MWALRDHDERAGAADNVVAVVFCKPARRVCVVGIRKGWGFSQNNESIDGDALGDRLVPRRRHGATTIVVAVPRNVDDAAIGARSSCAIAKAIPPLIDVLSANARGASTMRSLNSCAILSLLISVQSTTICCDNGPDHSMNVTAMRPLGPARMASITCGLEKAAAYPER